MRLFGWLKRNKDVPTECNSALGESKWEKLTWNKKLEVYEDENGNLFDNIDNGNGSYTLKRVSIFDERFLKHI